MSKWYKVEIPIFYGTLCINFSKDFKKEAKKLGVKCSNRKYLGLAFRVESKKDNNYCILIRRNDPSVIAHEALHVVNFMLKDLNLDINSDNDEVQCYLLSWVVKQIDIFNKKRKL
jgi:hypothetical protein